MIVYQAYNELGTQSFKNLRMAKEHIKAQELPGHILRMEIDFTVENLFRAIDEQGGYATTVKEVWTY